ncbi:uncharacterized protein [Spinacia oleracea]|uniref:Biogenesis of lysosome-related organelles complex 1 subunit 7 n=1 Tax=Spinacia oleracea TaxID=3562 RepID=A0ABM3RUB5_SPIOL|nr:uncharacterized protein LOC110805351 isoform X1 [Spinacia oleracea]
MSNSDTISIGIAANDDSYSVIPTIFSPECDNNNVNDDNIAGSSEALAEGISTMLAGVIRDFDSKAEDASRSQFQLISALDRLTSGFCDAWIIHFMRRDAVCLPKVEELDQLLEDAPLPFIMQHATKLSNVRKRVSSLNLLLRSVQHRLDNIDRMMSIGSLDNKSNVGGSK